MNRNRHRSAALLFEDVMGAGNSLKYPPILFQRSEQVPSFHVLMLQPNGCNIKDKHLPLRLRGFFVPMVSPLLGGKVNTGSKDWQGGAGESEHFSRDAHIMEGAGEGRNIRCFGDGVHEFKYLMDVAHGLPGLSLNSLDLFAK